MSIVEYRKYVSTSFCVRAGGEQKDILQLYASHSSCHIVDGTGRDVT
jgi:hypothetical protein